ncbi:Type II/IV secretion system protein [uncultured archaeon]|nr:Type II/IV secretion system protein [uncultured archaeon]
MPHDQLAPLFDSQVVEQSLGWRVFPVSEAEIATRLSENEFRDVVKTREGQKIYFLKRMMPLGPEEARLLRGALENYRGRGKKGQGAIESFREFVKANNFSLGRPQKEGLEKAVTMLFSPEGPLAELLEHECLEEIAVIGLGKSKPVHAFDAAFGWLPTNLYFASGQEVKNIANSLAGKSGRRVTFRTPAVNSFLRDGSRMNAVMEPAAVSGPCITIRKFRKEPFTPAELVACGSASAEQMAFLWMALQADCSALVCGNTGSGKTTLLNSLFNFIPKNERVVIVEETPEISVPHRHAVKLATSDGIGIGMQELIINTLRMRPDRVVIGEARSRKEVAAFVDTMLAGQGKGCYATFHAQSSEDAIARLQGLGVMPQDIGAIDLLLVQKRWTRFSSGIGSEERKLVEISEASAKKGAKGAAGMNRLFAYDFRKKKFFTAARPKRAMEKICRTFGIGEKAIEGEISRRAKFILDLRGARQEEFFNAIGNYGKLE